MIRIHYREVGEQLAVIDIGQIIVSLIVIESVAVNAFFTPEVQIFAARLGRCR